MNRMLKILMIISLMMLGGCQTNVPKSMPVVENLELNRFMGDWYVIANIPTFLEKSAHNAVESYELLPEQEVATTFRFRKDAFDGPLKVYHPTGFISDKNNAVWGMQFVWPFKAEYLVLHVDANYTRTIIGRSKRDYVWIMAREPQLSENEYRELVAIVKDAGYDPEKLQLVPQKWPESDLN